MPTNPLTITKAIISITNDGEEIYRVGGPYGVTKIERFTYPYSEIPYIRLWKGKQPFADFCLHNIIGIYYDLGQQ